MEKSRFELPRSFTYPGLDVAMAHEREQKEYTFKGQKSSEEIAKSAGGGKDVGTESMVGFVKIWGYRDLEGEVFLPHHTLHHSLPPYSYSYTFVESVSYSWIGIYS